jgi:hypothetical protein
VRLTAAIQQKQKADKFQYYITIPKKIQCVMSVKASNRDLTESENQQVAISESIEFNDAGKTCNM